MDDIAAAVVEVLDDPEPFAERGLQQAATFTWETGQAHEAVYRELAALA